MKLRWWEQAILEVYTAVRFALYAVLFFATFLFFTLLGIAILIIAAFIVYVGLMSLVEISGPDFLKLR